MTTLEAVDSGESLAAVAYLLNLVLKRSASPSHHSSALKLLNQSHLCSHSLTKHSCYYIPEPLIVLLTLMHASRFTLACSDVGCSVCLCVCESAV